MTLTHKLGSFYGDTKRMLKIMLEVDSAHQTECSMKAIRNGYELLCFRLMKNVSCEYTDGWLKLNCASCVIRQTRSFGVLVRYSICNTYGVCELNLR